MTGEMLVWLALGFGMVCLGGELLMRGSSRLATSAGLSPLLTGIVVVAFASNSPEMAVTAYASASGFPDLALGALVGCVIFTLLFVLGLCSLLLPAPVSRQIVRQDVPILLAGCVVLLVLSLDGRLNGLEGAVLLFCLLAYLAFLFLTSQRESPEALEEYRRAYGRAPGAMEKSGFAGLLFTLLALGFLILGSRWLVLTAVEIATGIGVTGYVVGLAVIGIGVSTPETATAIVAVLRGEREIAIGHLIGSSIFNLLGSLGLAALLSDGGLIVGLSALRLELPLLLAAAIGCLPVFLLGRLLPRWGGAVFVTAYVIYSSYLIINGTRHGDVRVGTETIVFFTTILILPALIVFVISRTARGKRASESAYPRTGTN